MPTELTSGLGLDIIIWLQENGNDVFDLLAKFFQSERLIAPEIWESKNFHFERVSIMTVLSATKPFSCLGVIKRLDCGSMKVACADSIDKENIMVITQNRSRE